MKNFLDNLNKQWISYLSVLLLVVAGVTGCQQQNGHPEKPNIILIMADDMGFSDLGSYGSEIHTPNLDRLGNEGIKFTQFYNTAKCTQTRASLLTGLYHQQTDNLKRADNNVTLAEVLNGEGYETIMAGKWHVGSTPMKRGFEHFFGFWSGAINYFTGENTRGENQMKIDGKKYDVPKDFYATDNFTDYAIKEIADATDKDNPFFLYLAYNAPHFPLQVPEEEINKYRNKYTIGWDSLRGLRYEKMKQIGLLKSQWQLSKRDSLVSPWDSLSKGQKKEEQLLMATYAGMVDRMDQQVGRLLDQLKQLNIEDNTVVLFLSDNGACPYDFNRTPNQPPGPAISSRTYDTEWANVSNTPFRKYKQWIHEGGIATPLIVRWPEKIKRGRTTNTPGQVIDIMPTLAQIAKADYPATYNGHPVLPMEGKSLLPVLRGNTDWNRGMLFWEYRGSRAVRDGKWKLVGERGKGWELYNLEQDRPETNDLIKKYPERASRMGKAYNKWAKRKGARTNKRALNMPVNRQSRIQSSVDSN